MMNNLSFNEFIEKYDKHLMLIGVFLAVFSISHKYLTETAKPWLAICTLIVLAILVFQLGADIFSYSFWPVCFIIAVFSIIYVIFRSITSLYSQEINILLNTLFSAVAFFGGILGGYLVFDYFEKWRSVNKNLLYAILAIISVAFIYFFNRIIQYGVDIATYLHVPEDIIQGLFAGLIAIFVIYSFYSLVKGYGLVKK